MQMIQEIPQYEAALPTITNQLMKKWNNAIKIQEHIIHQQTKN